MEVGDKIEARFGGRSRWFKGKISRKNRDGSYDVLYNDGDRERGVKSDLIRRIGGSSSSSRSKSPGRSSSKGNKDTDNECRYWRKHFYFKAFKNYFKINRI